MNNNPATLFAVTEVELTYRNKMKPSDRLQVRSSANAYDIFMSVWNMNKIQLAEQFYLLLLDRGNRCLGISHVFTGGVSTCIVDPKIVFATALKANASSMILAHNHPSGNLQPSKADMTLTEKLKNGGEIMDIQVADHLIVSPDAYYSFSDEGLSF